MILWSVWRSTCQSEKNSKKVSFERLSVLVIFAELSGWVTNREKGKRLSMETNELRDKKKWIINENGGIRCVSVEQEPFKKPIVSLKNSGFDWFTARSGKEPEKAKYGCGKTHRTGNFFNNSIVTSCWSNPRYQNTSCLSGFKLFFFLRSFEQIFRPLSKMGRWTFSPRIFTQHVKRVFKHVLKRFPKKQTRFSAKWKLYGRNILMGKFLDSCSFSVRKQWPNHLS